MTGFSFEVPRVGGMFAHRVLLRRVRLADVRARDS